MPSYYRRKMDEKEYYLALARRTTHNKRFSKYKGVARGTGKKPFRAALTHKGVRYWLGDYDNEIDAARAYNKAALRIIGDYALINDLPDTDSEPSTSQSDHGSARVSPEANGELHAEEH